MGAETDAARAVEELVAHYQAKARTVSRAAVAVGAFVGVAVGAIPLSPLHAAWPIPSSYGYATLLGGLVVGVLIGFVIGDPRAKLYRRMAVQARLQLQLEQRISQSDARMTQLLTTLTARAAGPGTTEATESEAAAPVRPAQPPLPVFVPPPPRLRTVPGPESESIPLAPPLSPPAAYDAGAR